MARCADFDPFFLSRLLTSRLYKDFAVVGQVQVAKSAWSAPFPDFDSFCLCPAHLWDVKILLLAAKHRPAPDARLTSGI
jgi:hypothetical protein